MPVFGEQIKILLRNGKSFVSYDGKGETKCIE